MSGTNLGKMPILIVSLVIGIVMATTAIVPLVSDYSDAKTFTNESYFSMQKITDEDTSTYTLAYVYDPVTQKLSYSYNGDAIDTSGWPISTYSVTIAGGSDWAMRANATSEYIGLQGVGVSFNWGGHNTRTVTATFASGTLTVARTYYDEGTNSELSAPSITKSYTEAWLYSPTQTDYVMKKMDSSAYLMDDSTYYALGVTAVTQWNTLISIEGNVSDFTAAIVSPANVTTTLTNKNIDCEEVSGYTDLYSLDKLTFTINDGTTTVNATYSYFIIPYEVTADPDNPAAYKALVKVVPVMAFVALIAAAAFMIYSKRD